MYSEVESMARRIPFLLLCILFNLTPALFSLSYAADTLTPAQPLLDAAGATLISDGGTFELGFFSPVGSSNRYVGMWFRNVSPQTVVWVANRNRPITDGSGILSLTANGTLVISDNSSAVLWSSSSPALASPVAQLLYSGNLVVRETGAVDGSSRYAWQSFDFPTNTLLPGMQLGWNLTSRRNRVLTAWASTSDPAEGNYTFGIDLRGDPQIFGWVGTQQYMRFGPWNGLVFSGSPEMMSSDLLGYNFVIDGEQVAFSYTVLDPSLIRQTVINPTSGAIEVLLRTTNSQSWITRTEFPRDNCDRTISLCGPYGLCYPDWPPCKCLPGFHPRNRNDWELLVNTSGGCERNTELDCRNNTDGFLRRSNVKLPDTSASTVDWSMARLDDCQTSCLNNCSCTAYARANISGSGRGCILWFTPLTDIKLFNSESGQDLFVRVAAADLKAMESSSSGRSRRGVIIVVSAVATLTFLTLVACCIWKRKKTKCSIREETEDETINLPSFDFAAIVQATDNFSSFNKLGEGGFGPVYKGRLKEREIAVKRLSKTSEQGADEFKNEVVSIAELQHRNLVRLLGYCIEANERMLIYEYMPNGSLDKFLFDKVKARSLDWKSRYNIILGIARGLLYLHHDSILRIIHRDLKASNILLDEDMNPKISDFGMAKIFNGNETIRRTKRVVGTYGYMSPEYIKTGAYSVKSDVFSFGVLILEIITGKKNIGFYISTEHLNLLEQIWTLWKEDRVLEAVDESMGAVCIAEVLKCINIGLLCVQEQSEDRPIMPSIVSFLGNETTQLLEPKRPGFVVPSDPSETNLSSYEHCPLPSNRLSITILEGR